MEGVGGWRVLVGGGWLSSEWATAVGEVEGQDDKGLHPFSCLYDAAIWPLSLLQDKGHFDTHVGSD